MANKVTVRVTRKRIKKANVGDTMEVSERDARVLERMKLVERVDARASVAAPVAVEESVVTTPRRSYRRRDMEAEE